MSTVVDFLQTLKGHSGRVAFIEYTSGKQRTYEALIERIELLAAEFTTFIQKGDRVLLHKLDPLDWIEHFFGVVLAGGVVVCTDARWNRAMLDETTVYTQPSIIITTSPDSFPTYADKIRAPFEHIGMRTPQVSLPVLDANDPSVIVFTSGTWSTPKGVTLSMRNILSNAHAVLEAYQHKPQHAVLGLLPLAHAYQLTVGVMVPLLAGSTIVLMGEPSASLMLDAIKKYHIHTVVAVPKVLIAIRKRLLGRMPSALAKLLPTISVLPLHARRAVFSRIHRSIGKSLRVFIIGGAPLPNVVDRFFQAIGYRTLVGYGLSETAPVLTLSVRQRRREGEVGKPLPNVTLTLNGESEVIAAGPNVFLGYWPNQTFSSAFNTHDIGILHKGRLILTGRKRNMLVYPSGDKMFYEDLEHLIEEHDGIHECGVMNIGTDALPVLACAIVTARKDTDECMKTVSRTLPSFIRIEQWIWRTPDQPLPRTLTAKIDRKELVALISSAGQSYAS